MMGILAVNYQAAPDAVILIAHNREDLLERGSSPPRILYGRPKVLCPLERKDGGTCLGVNQHGLVVAVIRRGIQASNPGSRSLPVLCRELLNCASAAQAIDRCVQELSSGQFDPANFLCVDRRTGAVVHSSGEIEVLPLSPGLHILTSSSLDDPEDPRQEFVRRMMTLQRLDSAVAFLAAASRVFSKKADAEGRRGLVVSGPEFGTVWSALLAVTTKPSQAVFHFAPGPPSEFAYDDYSAFLRQVLSADRNGRAK
jgi:hypothetical protein